MSVFLQYSTSSVLRSVTWQFVVLTFLFSCSGLVRETTPGPQLPAVHPYDVTEALIPHPVDTRKDIRVSLSFAPEVDDGLQLRILSLLNRPRKTDGVLSPWPATFIVSDTDEGFSHRLEVEPLDQGIRLTAYEIVEGEKRPLKSVDLQTAVKEPDGPGMYLTATGRPVRLRKVYPDLTADARKALLSFAMGLGMGELQIRSTSRASVFLKQGERLLSLGDTPVDIQMRSGLREIVLRRHGQPEQTRIIRIPDSDVRVLQASWSDDSDPGSVQLFTSPEGYRIAMDGEVMGESPVARSGILAGVYELEVAKKSGEDDFMVVAEDRLHVRGGRRTDRLYPLDYYLRFRGAALQAALESGLWGYSASDQRFYITDFANPSLAERSGLISIPIGSKKLQVESVLPGQSASFGVYSEADRFLIEPAADRLRLRLSVAGQMQVLVLQRKPGRQIYVLVDIDREAGTLVCRVNGKTLYDGPFATGSSVRLVSIGSPFGSAPPEEIHLRGDGNVGGPLFRTARFLWYTFKTVSDSPLRLREEDR